MFCRNCGHPCGVDDHYCGSCGASLRLFQDTSRMTSVLVERRSPASADLVPISPLAPKTVEYQDVRIEFRVKEETCCTSASKIVLTEGRILFIDAKGLMRPWKMLLRRRSSEEKSLLDIPPWEKTALINLSKIWTLSQSANEEMDREFWKNPRSYSKLRGAWWVRGCREWLWVNSIRHDNGNLDERNNYVDFGLSSVWALAHIFGGKQAPTTYSHTHKARVFLTDAHQAMALYNEVRARVDLRAEAFSPAYIANYPVLPVSTLVKIYSPFSLFCAGGVLTVAVSFALVPVALILRFLGMPAWMVGPVWLTASLTGGVIALRYLVSKVIPRKGQAEPSL